MAQHKWHKEIKAWADGAEIEYHAKNQEDEPWMPFDGRWTNNESWEYRIKPQPKEPQYLYVYKRINGTGESYSFESTANQSNPHWTYIGKIKLEEDV